MKNYNERDSSDLFRFLTNGQFRDQTKRLTVEKGGAGEWTAPSGTNLNFYSNLIYI